MLTGGVKDDCEFLRSDDRGERSFYRRRRKGMIRITCDGETYSVKYLAGMYRFRYSDSSHTGIVGSQLLDFQGGVGDKKNFPKTLVIIGGGVIGMEFASFFNSMGVKVHVVEMMPEILGAMDKETSGMLRAEYAKRGVTFYLNTKVVEVNAHGVVIEKEGKVSTIEAEKILLSVGRKANLSKWDWTS